MRIALLVLPNKSRIRLQKYLAQAGVAARRKCEACIAAGRVTVNGAVVTARGTTIDPARDRVALDGEPVRPPKNPVYLLLYKPPGVLTTLSDPGGRPTIVDLLPNLGRRLFPVGRLDKDTEGLLLLTDDGAFAQSVAHPSSGIPKTYEATVRGRPGRADLHRLASGVDLVEGRTAPAQIQLVAAAADSAVRIILHEGRNRQVRRMFDVIEHPVIRLKRIGIGPIGIGSLRPGKWRHLKPAEVDALQGIPKKRRKRTKRTHG